MTSKETSVPNEEWSISPKKVGFIFTLLAIYAPAFIEIIWAQPNSPVFQMWGMLWHLFNSVDFGGWYLEYTWIFSIITQSIEYTLLRPVFAYQMVRYYQNKSSRKMTLLIGLIVELQPFIMGLDSTLSHLHLFLVLRLPIPVLLIAALLVMKVAPPQEEPESWLDEKIDDSEEIALSKLDLSYKVLETALVSEIILFLLGGIFVTNMHPVPIRFLYGFVIPWALLITALLYLILRNIRSRRALWALYGPD